MKTKVQIKKELNNLYNDLRDFQTGKHLQAQSQIGTAKGLIGQIITILNNIKD
jgi:hypothetical protein